MDPEPVAAELAPTQPRSLHDSVSLHRDRSNCCSRVRDGRPTLVAQAPILWPHRAGPVVALVPGLGHAEVCLLFNPYHLSVDPS